MSRHRFVRAMDLATAEKEYEALSDGGEDPEDEITPEQLAQMNSVREHVRAVIGPPRTSGILDKEIDDASWEFYFDLDQTMDHILEMQNKRNAAKERQASEEVTSSGVEMKLSKLQLLSLAKKAEQASSPRSLASFAKSATSPLSPEMKSPNPMSPKFEKGGVSDRPLSKLAQLSARSKATPPPSPGTKITVTSPTGLSKLAQKINASKSVSNTKVEPPADQTLPVWEIRPVALPAGIRAHRSSDFGSILAIGVTSRGSKTLKKNDIPIPSLMGGSAFQFDSPSPDDLVIHARRGTTLAHYAQLSR
ncbi:Hsp70 suppressor, GTPase facilitates ribosomal subunit dissociation [Serendipita sp. 400]|nr:Hsp70 suppressor, GTPase facilitates ribosomal subunit dissociation [Serendipita sp. 400]